MLEQLEKTNKAKVSEQGNAKEKQRQAPGKGRVGQEGQRGWGGLPESAVSGVCTGTVSKL